MDEAVKSEVDALRDDFKQIKEDLKGLTATIGQLAAKQGPDVKASLEDHVREKPLNTLLLAFAVGLVLGKGFGR